jgi:hypothetical protein
MSVPVVVAETKQGECKVHITLDLNINLTGNTISIDSVKATKEEKPEFTIPEFASGTKVKFGKEGEL